jgi:hypothetical protein
MKIILVEKYCSHCGLQNWDSETGFYNEDCTAKGREGQKCDINGQVLKYDENNNIVP